MDGGRGSVELLEELAPASAGTVHATSVRAVLGAAQAMGLDLQPLADRLAAP